MTLLRFRLRTLMVAVAVVAAFMLVGVECFRASQRAARYRSLALRHELLEAERREAAEIARQIVRDGEQTLEKLVALARTGQFDTDGAVWEDWERTLSTARQQAQSSAAAADEHARLRRQYARAARFPWVDAPVEPPEAPTIE